MTEYDIQDVLFKRFLELNDFSGIQFLEPVDSDGRWPNVHFPNEPFEFPESGRWFDLTFLPNEPEPTGLFEEAQNGYTGLLYVDIYTPVDAGESEAKEKYTWIARLFSRGLDLGDGVDITRCYISTRDVDNGQYRLQAAVEWSAEIDKE